MTDEPVEQREYTIMKYPNDGSQPIQDKSSVDYTGKATVQYPNGDVYEGTFKNGVRDGEGTYTYVDGTKYEGTWKNNMKHGRGVMKYGTVAEYKGDFENGKRDGEGVYRILKTNDLYSGSWKNGYKHGYGTFIFNDTKIKIKGEWSNGQVVHGKWMFPNGTYFEGKFEHNYPKGEGVWHFSNGKELHGEFTQAIADEEGHERVMINWNTFHKEETIDELA